ncbi:MAG: N4-gp56 family major capsid protein [Candidatus Dormibacteraceae bacterium]
MSTPSSSSSSNYSSAHIDAYIRKRLLEFGPNRHLLRRFANKEKLPGGVGTQWKALRSERITIPTASLTEGVTPSNTPVTISYVTCTAIQWGVVVVLTDVLMLTIAAPVFQEAIKTVAEVMDRLDDKLLHDTLLAATNVFFPVKSYTARSSLTNADVPSTKMIRRLVSSLRLGSTKLGGAKPQEGKMFPAVTHDKHIMDF